MDDDLAQEHNTISVSVRVAFEIYVETDFE